MAYENSIQVNRDLRVVVEVSARGSVLIHSRARFDSKTIELSPDVAKLVSSMLLESTSSIHVTAQPIPRKSTMEDDYDDDYDDDDDYD